ncbi:MAG: hypothetical protein AB7O97_16615 [Planctomycetota bacterium]
MHTTRPLANGLAPLALPLALLPLALLPLAGCGDATSRFDPDLQKRVETVQDCFPELFDKVEVLLDLAALWRMKSGGSIPDPAGLTWSAGAGNDLDVTFVVGGCTLTAVIDVFGPNGEDETATIASTLADTIDQTATALALTYGTADKFMLAQWTISGGGISGSGNLTGIVGGVTNQNELELIYTSAATVSGGPPVVDDSAITGTTPSCSLVFRTAGLQTDTEIGQQYPIGTLTATLTGPDATVTVTATFDDTSIVRIVVSDIAGTFLYDLDSGSITFQA